MMEEMRLYYFKFRRGDRRSLFGRTSLPLRAAARAVTESRGLKVKVPKISSPMCPACVRSSHGPREMCCNARKRGRETEPRMGSLGDPRWLWQDVVAAERDLEAGRSGPGGKALHPPRVALGRQGCGADVGGGPGQGRPGKVHRWLPF